MKSWETSTTVEQEGQIRVVGVPFAPGTEVEVTISARRKSAEEFTKAWQRVCGEMRTVSGLAGISDDKIWNEINSLRTRILTAASFAAEFHVS